MGFEQLAPLRDELAQQATAQKKLKSQKKKDDAAAPAKKVARVDPVVLTIGLLQKKFPLAFPKNPNPKLPLKIGIHKDLFEQAEQLGVNKNELRAAIKTWCWGNRYWDCLVEDAVRVDLNGSPVGGVTKEDADQAKKLKAGRRKKPEAAEVTPTESS